MSRSFKPGILAHPPETCKLLTRVLRVSRGYAANIFDKISITPVWSIPWIPSGWKSPFGATSSAQNWHGLRTLQFPFRDHLHTLVDPKGKWSVLFFLKHLHELLMISVLQVKFQFGKEILDRGYRSHHHRHGILGGRRANHRHSGRNHRQGLDRGYQRY